MSTAYTLRSWTDVVEPHADVRSGDLAMGTYAANLAVVAAGRHTGAAVYSDPSEFFGSTYFTEAMCKVLGDAWGVLAGESGDRVLQLRTPFGGGKTHTLLALFHLATSPEAARGVPELAGLSDPGLVRTAVLSGEYIDPQRGREVDGRRIQTMWGELAYQLGGWEAYEGLLVDGDEGVPPGGELLGRLLGDEPSLVLIDEAILYVAKGRSVQRGDSDMARLTMLFLQNLSEAVNQSSRAALVYSLQSSVGEAVGEEQLLRDLEKIAARIDTRREPVSGDEVLRVVQRRLFESLGDEAVHDEVAKAYAENFERELMAMAETESDRREARDRAQALEQRILLAYPFHPELIDIMQHRWASLPSYQRTRGALQFLATVVHALWSGEGRAGALIGPGDVDLAHEGTRNTFFEQVGEERQYRAVVEADFLADDAGARLVDERLGGESPALANLRVGTRVATAVMLMSFGQREGEGRGALEREVLDASVTPELDGNLVRAALRELRGEALLYLHHTGRRYRFESRPNLNKLIVAEQDKLHPSEVRTQVQRALDRDLSTAGAAGEVILWPEAPEQVDDRIARFRVVYLPPEWSEDRLAPGEFVMANQRQFKNAFALVTPRSAAFDRARAAARAVLAVERLIADKARHGFSPEQIEELRERQRQAAADLTGALSDAYERVLLPSAVSDGKVEFEQIDLGTVLGAGQGLHGRVRTALSNYVFDKLTPAKLKAIADLGERGSARCEQLLDQIYSFFGLPRLWRPEAVKGAISGGVEKGLFAYCIAVEGDGSDVSIGDPAQIRFREVLAPEEFDLGPGAALLSPELARGLLEYEDEELPEEPPSEDSSSGPVAAAIDAQPNGHRRVVLSVRATKDDLHTLRTALAGLRDLVGESGSLRIELKVEADPGAEPIDPIRLQNMVLQHLEEDPDVDFEKFVE
jgi:Protein of unknown function (DUF499)